MNKKELLIKEGLKKLASEHGPIVLLDGTVLAVDSDDYFADILLDTGETIYNCRLRAASIGNQSIDVLPAVGSAVVLAKMTEDDYLALSYDEIDSFRVTVGDMVLTQTSNGFKISNGIDSLKDILNDQVTEILGIYAPKDIAGITAIQTRINALLQ